MPERSDHGRALAFASVAIIASIALALRWIAAQQSLFQDELWAYAEVTPSSLAHVFDRMDMDSELNPPVYFVFAWLSAKIGDPTMLIRLPSVIAGTATVPVVYLLGNAIAGRRCGITAAALFAVMPFAVFYGSEGRPYALLLFLITLSTLALLRALEAKQGLSWWFVYSAACALALYTHYIAGIAIAAQAGWALTTQFGRWRAVLAANATVALAFLPWLPMVKNDAANPVVLLYERLHPLTLENVLSDSLRVIFGHPIAGFDQVPGLVSIVAACLVAAMIAVGLWGPPTLRRRASATRSWRAGGSVEVPRVGWLLLSLTGGVFVLTFVYSVLDTSIYWPRNTITALPYLCLLGGVAAAALEDRLARVAAGALVVAALLGSLRMLVDYPRPDRHAAADAIADRAPPGTPVVEPRRVQSVNSRAFDPLQQGLAIYLDDGFPLSRVDNVSDWPRRRETYAVATGSFYIGLVDAIARRAGAQPVETLSFDGFEEVTVTRYSAVGGTGVSGSVADRNRSFRTYLERHPEASQRFRPELRAYLKRHPAARERFRPELRAYLERHPAAREEFRRALQGGG